MNSPYSFQVPALSCGHCVAAITKALATLGVQVMADPTTRRVDVSAPAGVSREQLVAALTAAGYPPA